MKIQIEKTIFLLFQGEGWVYNNILESENQFGLHGISNFLLIRFAEATHHIIYLNYLNCVLFALIKLWMKDNKSGKLF